MFRTKTLASLVALLAVAFVLRAQDAKDGNLLKPTNKTESWRLEQHDEGKGEMSVDGDAILFNVTKAGGEEWHVQTFQTKLDLKDGKEYTLTFKAKAAADRDIKAQAAIDEEDWHNIGLDETASLTKDWKAFEYTFEASEVKAGNNRVGFVLGGAAGKVWIKDAVLKQK